MANRFQVLMTAAAQMIWPTSFVEYAAGLLVHRVRHVPVGDERDRLGQRERGPLPLGLERGLPPGVQGW
jgi:hypothetical protein